MNTFPISYGAARRRAHMLSTLRRTLDQADFIEITTPVLLKARPGGPESVQRIRVAELDLDLRTSIELHLRTALIAANQVYDIGPAIRLEDIKHPGRSAVEFTLLELYMANIEYQQLLDFSENLIRSAAPCLPKAQRISVADWFADEMNVSFERDGEKEYRQKLIDAGGGNESDRTYRLINEVIGARLERHLKGFVFLTNYPVETVCLARRCDGAPHIIERFEVFIDDLEIGHGFVDEMDADDLLDRMHRSGPEHTDSEFVTHLRTGSLPPSGGFGLGVERLLAATEESETRDLRRFIHAYQH